MQEHLEKLKKYLSNNNKNCAVKIAQIQNKIKPPQNLTGEIPDFKWLEDGFLFKGMNPKFIEAFIEENDVKLSQFDVKKYLGRGKIGDAWELDDGRVLKIFDAGAKINGVNDITKYKHIIKLLHSGDGDETLPMVYEIGEFNIPKLFNGVKSRSTFNMNSQFYPAYVILEKVNAFDSTLKDNVLQNSKRYELQFDYDGDIINEEDVYRPLDVDDTPVEIQDYFIDAVDSDEYGNFIKKWMHYVMDSIISELIMAYDDMANNYDFDKELDDLSWNEMLEDPQFRKKLTKDMLNRFDSMENINEEMLNKLEYLLGLPFDWKEQLTEAVVENLSIGREDLHLGNFGFRNNKIVFYDG